MYESMIWQKGFVKVFLRVFKKGLRDEKTSEKNNVRSNRSVIVIKFDSTCICTFGSNCRNGKRANQYGCAY